MPLWRTRILAKRILSRMPVSYRRWASVGLFRHGDADDPAYVWGMMERHVQHLPRLDCPWQGLELGPGDGLLSALIAPAFGSAGVTLVDAGDFAHRDVDRYRSALKRAAEQHPDVAIPHIGPSAEASAMLAAVQGAYFTNGLASLRRLPSDQFDFIWSQAVLEHVRVGEYAETAHELRRLLRPHGVMSHVVDFKDHLGGALNNLRFPSARWEDDDFAPRSGFYTNRLRYNQTIALFEAAGFAVEIISTKRWDASPIQRRQLAPEFAALSDEDLLISGAHLIMRPA